jgi:cytoskeletal protein CcmA (bactofilin family)
MQVNMFLKTNKAVEAAALNANSNNTAPKKGTPSILSADMHILGNLVSEGAIDIDGSIEGNVKGNQITVRAQGKITGDITAEVVHVYGQVRGLIRAHAVHLYASSHVEGVIMYHSLTVEDGAFVDGKFKRIQEKSMHDMMPTADFGEDFEDEGFLESQPMLVGNNLRLIS